MIYMFAWAVITDLINAETPFKGNTMNRTFDSPDKFEIQSHLQREYENVMASSYGKGTWNLNTSNTKFIQHWRMPNIFERPK